MKQYDFDLPVAWVNPMVDSWDTQLKELLPQCLSYFAAHSLNTLGELASLSVRATIAVAPEAGFYIGLYLLRLYGKSGETADVTWPTAVIDFQPDSEPVPTQACAVLIDNTGARRFMGLIDVTAVIDVEADGRFLSGDLRDIVTIVPGAEHWTSSHYLPEGWKLNYTDLGLSDYVFPYGYGILQDNGSEIRLSLEDDDIECILYRVPASRVSDLALAWLTAEGPDDSQLLLVFQRTVK